MKQTIAQALNAAILAREACRKSGNDEWEERWNARIDAIMESAPSGSGFDMGTQLGDGASPTRLVFATSFHHMKHGMYDGWTEHLVKVTPTFEGLDIKVSGRNRDGIKEFIIDTFGNWLNQPVPEIAWKE